MLEVQF